MFRYPAFPFAALTTCFWLAASSVLFASSSVLTWSVLPPDPGGFGNWSNQDSAWFDEEGNPSSWQQGADALFSEAEGMASVRGSLDVGTLTALSQDTPIELDHLQFAQLTVRNIVGSPLFWFRQNIGAGANNYPEFNLLSQLGLVFRSDEPIVFTGTLFPLQGGSPFVSVRGPETVVDFAGTWIADTGSIISWLMPIESGTFRFTGEADMRFIKEDYYTLQLWVHGDGTGTLELAEDFQADRTNNATVPLGIGSIRISSTTLVTHHTRNLPLGYRPFGADRTQANGHLAFENGGGSRWIVRSHPQEYPGALWIYRDLEIHTEADLTHTGVTESAPDYTAFNGITLFGSSLVKSGPARLRLAGHQAYQPGSSMEIIEGGIDFITDPSGGIAFGGGRPMGELFLTVQEGSEASFHAPATIGDLAVAGTVSIGSSLRVAGDMGLFSLPEANWHFTLGSTSEHDPILVVETAAEFAGTIHLWRNAEFVPTPGARIPLLTANNLNLDTGWVLVDHTQTGVSLELDGNTLYAVTTRIAADTAGRILLEDFFEDLSQWSDLSTVPLWGNPQRHRSAFSTANNHVQLIREGPDTTAGWTNFSNANGLKTFTAIDHAFDEPVDRESSTLVVDARIRWHTVSNSSGEGGRFILSFTYDYPQGGLDLTPEGEPGSRIADFSQHWWAKPAYHLRMRNSDSRAGTSFLQYGGGPVFGGEFERTSGNFGYWLPGFISGAGGVAPGSGPDFPANSWVSTLDGLASATFRTYRYILYPDRQEVWRDDNDNGIFDPDELKAVMPLPLTSDAPFYAYIPSIEGLRLFWNGVGEGSAGDTGQVYVDWLRIIQNDTLLPEPRMRVPDIFVIYNGVNGKVLLDASETVLPNAGGALYQWYVDGSLTVSTHQQVTAARLAVGERVIGLRVTDALGNQAYTEQMVIISPGNLLPIARPGDSQTITANDRLLARVSVDGSASSDPDGEIVRYRWTRANGTIVLSDGADAAISTVLPVGLHRLNLTVFDEEGASSSADVSIQVVSPNIGASEVIYRENFPDPTRRSKWDLGRLAGI
ncbi:MAG: PKD domain-containing protein [Verrucomicrobia bacterium]|nr:PKD domain-containing protein [Verrucomicrobiota bacterium]